MADDLPMSFASTASRLDSLARSDATSRPSRRRSSARPTTSFQTHGLDGHGDVSVPGDEDHRQIHVDLPSAFQQCEAVHSRQLDVGQQHAWKARHDVRERLFCGFERPHLMAGQLHGLRAAESYGGIVLDVEDGRSVRREFHDAAPI
jgi:hypothetical protein